MSPQREEAVPDADLLHQAEAAFRAGAEVRANPDEARPLFRRAASCYEELGRHGAHNVDLYRDLGNAYLLAGDLPRALLSYRRGLRLAPADPARRANLAHAREHFTYPGPGELGRPAVDNRPPWLPYLRPNLRLLLCFCLYSLGWLGITRWWMIRQAALLRFAVLTASGRSLPPLMSDSAAEIGAP